MAKVRRFNLKREKVGELELCRRGLRRRGQGAPVPRGRRRAARLAARGHQGRQGARGGRGLVEEDLPAEGHRPCSSRLDPRAALRGRRSRPPAEAARLVATARRVACASARSKCALSLLFKEGRLIVVDNIDLGEIKTKKLAGVLDTLEARQEARSSSTSRSNENLRLSIRNMTDSQFLPPEGVNVYDLLRHEHLVVSKAAAKALEARCLEQEQS